MEKILKIENKKEEEFLRNKAKDFDFSAHSRREVADLVARMRKAMEEANGIGLAANQIGLDFRLFVAKWDDKFYAVFNPSIKGPSKEKEIIEEGCLSIPGKYGEVKRPAGVTLVGQSATGKKIKIKAWDMLARIFQHEVDHLNGKLYVDRMSRRDRIKRLDEN
ncbi:MAG: peptide deformylase [Candidatus Colwellbacteria bacterium]